MAIDYVRHGDTVKARTINALIDGLQGGGN